MASFFKSIPIFGRDSALRQWLQSLTTGEAGFMNVCVGSTAFTFALYRHNEDVAKANLTDEARTFNREYDHVLDQITLTKPETLLDAIAWHRQTLASEASSAGGVSDPTTAELADEWMRRRLFPQDDLVLGVREVPDAARINEYRIQLKRMWHAIRRLHVKHPHLTMVDRDGHSDGPGQSTHRSEINDELNNGLARSTLQLLEPLDQALCRSRPGCEWSRDCDKIYAFIREHWNIPKDWPGDGTASYKSTPSDSSTSLNNDFVLDENVTNPTTRVAAAMAARMSHAEKEFQLADKDGDGRVDQMEFAEYLKRGADKRASP
jgi:hypothetical protein